MQQRASVLEHVSIQLENGVLVNGVYVSPIQPIAERDISVFFPANSQSLLLGDLNARHRFWNNHRNNRKGTILCDYIHSDDQLQLLYTDTPTHYPTNNMTPTYIDIGINKGLRDVSELVTVNALNSDHIPVCLRWGERRNVVNQTVFSYQNFNWNLYRQRLNELTVISGHIETVEELEAQVSSMTRNIQRVQEELATRVPAKPKENRLPQDIVDLIKVKNTVRRRWQRYRHDGDRQLVTELTNTIRQRINDYRNEHWTRTLTTLSTNDNSLWKMAKGLRKKYQKLPVINSNGRDILRDDEKAEAFADFLAALHSDPPNTRHEHDIIQNTASRTTERKYPIPPPIYASLRTTPGEICKYLRSLPNGKAPGPDGIPYLLLKNLPRKTIVQLMHIINAIFLLQHFPNDWKKAVVILVHKPGKDPSLPSSYRPISLLNTLGKLTEKIVLVRINRTVESLSILPPEQFGFRPRHNTTLLAAKLTTDIFSGFNREMNTVLLLLDMERAFDTVWHAGLIYKLAHVHGLPLHLVALVYSFIKDRKFQVRVENVLSSSRPINAGVPQGTVLSPQLYSLYTADIPKYPNTKLALYADDTAIYAQSYYAQAAKSHLVYHLNLLTPYYEKWKLRVNANKTELLVLTKKFTNNKIMTPLVLNNTPITPSRKAKYLGIIFDERMYFKPHISHCIQKTFAGQQKLYPLICPRSPLSPANKLTIYKSIIRPVMTYGAPVWSIVSDTQRLRLQRFQNRILRGVLSAGRYTRIRDLHAMSGVEPVSDFLDQVSEKFYTHGVQGSALTRDITRVRYDPESPVKHGPPYKRLPIYFRQQRNQNPP